MNVSIGIIVSYESRATIAECLRAIECSLDNAISQIRNFEILIIKSNICHLEVESISNKARVINSITNNLAENRNLILDHAKYEYIYFTDPDCTLSLDTFKTLTNRVTTQIESRFFAIAGHNINIFPNAKYTEFFKFLGATKILNMGSAQLIARASDQTHWHAPTCNILYFRAAIGQSRFNNRYYSYGEDLDFNLNVSQKSGRKILIVPQAEVIHHQSKSFFSFLKKTFGYGIAQAQLLKQNGLVICNLRLLPLLLIVVLTVGFLFSGTKLYFLPIAITTVYFLFFLLESLNSKEQVKLRYLFWHFGLAMVYLSGQIVGFFTRKSRNIFVKYEIEKLG